MPEDGLGVEGSHGPRRNSDGGAEKAELSAEAADLRARVGATDMVNAAPTTLDETLDELRGALSKALERF